MLRRFFQFSQVPLGRWTRTDSSANAIKVDWANTDHCGTCSLPLIPQLSQLSQLPLIPMPSLDLKNFDEETRRMKRRVPVPVPVHRRAETYRALTPVPRKAEAPVPSLGSAPATPLTSSLANSVTQGFGWGLGNAMAATLMNASFPKAIAVPAVPAVPAQSLEYERCMKDFDDKEACKRLLEKQEK